MVLALIGFAELAAFWWLRRMTQRLVRRLNLIVDVLERQAEAYGHAVASAEENAADVEGLAEPDTP